MSKLINLKQLETIIGEIHSITYPKNQGATSEVVFLQTSAGQFVSKSAKRVKYKAWLSKEAEAMKILKEVTTLPIPTFYIFIEGVESQLIMSLVEGITLREALLHSTCEKEKLVLFQSFGALLKQLHETEPPVPWITDECWLDKQLQKATYYLENDSVEGDKKLLEKLKEYKPNSTKQTLIHGDCTIDNVLVSNGKVHTFIDLAGTTYGDPRYDIALATRSIRDNEEMLQAFYKGYVRQTISVEEFNYFDEGLYEFF
ncbi:aminoglycoside phosphotransferase family protein [Bacillus sp. FJAT-22090]|uniref:aminoglycoside phosphotransferase family protein n=1 Tax=Bacillus sp. FJAT-22090 TaxID=1581038 RepID=UPI0011A77A3A|nr:aminoglycoside phosphotransferase family protein [Bacillus sp. FJAT-22090]